MAYNGISNRRKSPNEPTICFSDPANGEFRELHNVLERRFRGLHEQGIGTATVQARVITRDEEYYLWASGVLGSHHPSALLNAMFYYNRLYFVLRGGQEHRDLKLSQVVTKSVLDPDKPSKMIDVVEYTEHGSKNRPGGRHQLNLSNKTVTHFASPELGDRCYVYLLKLYFSKLPSTARERDIFYWKPRDKPSSPDNCYTQLPIGHNMLDKSLKVMFEKADLDCERITNHSLRATSISRMYNNNVPRNSL